MQAELTFWEWAQRNGYGVKELAEKLHYAPEHVSRLKNGRVPITVDFVARVVLTFGDQMRQFFLDIVPVDTDRTTVTTANGCPPAVED